MGPIINVGGSVTGAIGVVLAIWGYKAARNALRPRDPKAHHRRELGRFFADLSPQTIALLSELDAIPHVILDLREEGDAAARPLRVAGRRCPSVPEGTVTAALGLGSEQWIVRHGAASPAPRQDHLVICAAEDEAKMLRAASQARAAGYERVAIVRGGVAALLALSDSAAQGMGPRPSPTISREGLAAIMQLRSRGLISPDRHVLIDVRRSDERVLYGSIRGSVHVPVDQMPAALALGEEEFSRRFRFPRPRLDDVLVFHSRGRKRATWAAHMAREAGYSRCFVYDGGTCGWRLDAGVLPYASYSEGSVPPEPERVPIEDPQLRLGVVELTRLGLIEDGQGPGLEEMGL